MIFYGAFCGEALFLMVELQSRNDENMIKSLFHTKIVALFENS